MNKLNILRAEPISLQKLLHINFQHVENVRQEVLGVGEEGVTESLWPLAHDITD